MSQTFVFEELDETTRSYLTAVRDAQGAGAPGVFAPTKSSMAGCGCIAGPIIIALTLALTLTNWIGVVYDDPIRVALLQTAGLLVGGWLLIAGIRSSGMKGNNRIAGHWVYLDSLHLYQAYREQVKITKIDDAVEANFTHNYNNGAYQNSVVNILFSGNASTSVALNNEQRAEQMVVYLNYLAWARGPEGGERASLPPTSLGGLAKYVAKNDAEPKDAEDNINLNLVELDITEVPEEPVREGRAMPSFLPYIAILAAGAGIFYVMAFKVNPMVRDDALYEAVCKVTQPPSIEPRFLRVYLIDPRNTRHRTEVQQKLASFYDDAIQRIPQQGQGADANLRNGMVEILRSLKDADQPIVSLKVSEEAPKAGAEERVKKLREDLVGQMTVNADGSVTVNPNGILGELARLMPPIQEPPGVTFNPKPPPIGVQLIDFAQMPDDAKHAHFEVTYQFVQTKANPKLYQLVAKVEFRTNLDNDKPDATYTEDSRLVPETQFSQGLEQLKDRVLLGMLGKGANPGPVIPGMPKPK